jgi:hypothetical protein
MQPYLVVTSDGNKLSNNYILMILKVISQHVPYGVRHDPTATLSKIWVELFFDNFLFL